MFHVQEFHESFTRDETDDFFLFIKRINVRVRPNRNELELVNCLLFEQCKAPIVCKVSVQVFVQVGCTLRARVV